MADNTRLFLGTGGDLIRTEDVGGVYKIPVSKIYVGAPGVDGGPVTTENPFPVTVPGLVNVQGTVNALPTTGVVIQGATPLTPKHAAISASQAGSNVLVAAVPGKQIRVLQYVLVAAGAVGAEFRSGSASALTGSMPLAANGGVGVSASVLGHFETALGEALTLNLSAAVSVAGHLTYVEV
jgi:hypothetical protein